MINKIRNTIKKYDMFSASPNVSVALSGGADSVCLLYSLLKLKDEFNLNISALHLNHNLRGEESERDERFVRELCDKLMVPLKIESVDVLTESERRSESIELTARDLRYDFFKRNTNGTVAIAHTASDNLETVIYNLTRGSGIRGICGIPPKRDIYIRPLIEVTSNEVRGFLEENEIDFVIDSSNLTDDYTRNYIRHNVVPHLKKINPSVEQTIISSGSNLREDSDFLNETANKIYCITSLSDGLDAKLLREQPKAIAKRVLGIYFFEKTKTHADSFHINQMYAVLVGGTKQSLPENRLAICSETRFKIIANEISNVDFETSVIYETVKKDSNVYNLLLKNAIDCDRIKGSLVVRTRNEGDSIKISGRKCTKSLKKLFNEQKIPLEERANLPVAVDDEGLVWVYGIGVAQRVMINEKTVNIARFDVNKI